MAFDILSHIVHWFVGAVHSPSRIGGDTGLWDRGAARCRRTSDRGGTWPTSGAHRGETHVSRLARCQSVPERHDSTRRGWRGEEVESQNEVVIVTEVPMWEAALSLQDLEWGSKSGNNKGSLRVHTKQKGSPFDLEIYLTYGVVIVIMIIYGLI